MANFYNDTPQFRHYLQHPLMKRIVELKERNYTESGICDYAPIDFEDAMDSYDKVLEVVGEICGEIIDPNAEEVDQNGPTVSDGRVTYASKTQENLDVLNKAELMGMRFGRKYGGLNLPMVPYMITADIVSRADASFQNIWMLQDCGETIYEFGDEHQKDKYISRVVKGETMSMDLTEPDAGSDLQAVMLKATFNEKENQWYLNGVKRFITNGDADIHLVLARSEEGTKDDASCTSAGHIVSVPVKGDFLQISFQVAAVKPHYRRHSGAILAQGNTVEERLSLFKIGRAHV